MKNPVEYLRECKVFYLATCERNQPRVRPFGAVALYQNHVYFMTANTKKVYRQLKENPLAEVCAMHPDGTWIRINGNVIWDNSREAKVAMLEQNPDLRSMYSEDDGKMEVFYLGGGSVTDCCKIVCAQAVTDHDLCELEMVQRKAPTVAPIPLGAVVTASGTGAEMNGGAVITNEEAKIKGGMFAAAPRFAVLDPEYTMSLPRMQVLSGAFDTLSHAMETYFGRSDRDNVSDEVALAVMHSTVVNMRTLLKDINDYTARSNLMWTSAMAENGILKVGRVTDFECHQMEHQLGAYTDCNHGQGLAVLHPAYYRHIVKDAPEKFDRLGRAVFGVEGAEAAVDALAAFIRECGLPTRLGQLKSKVEITPELLRQVADSVNLLPNGPRQLTHDEVYEILKECL